MVLKHAQSNLQICTVNPASSDCLLRHKQDDGAKQPQDAGVSGCRFV